MEWINWYGIVTMAAIMIPNIVYGIKCKEGFENRCTNKLIIMMEQIGRYGSFALMIITIPHVTLGYWLENGEIVYIVVNLSLCTAYCVLFIILWNKNNVFRGLILSILPSVIFVFSGIIKLNIPLLAVAVIFAIGHITLSYKNEVMRQDEKHTETGINYGK